jgi:hypothetical protein
MEAIVMNQPSRTSWGKIVAVWIAFAAPFALGIYLTLRDALPLLAKK